MKLFSRLIIPIIFVSLLLPLSSQAKTKSREYFEIRVYHFTTIQQETAIDSYLRNALLPAMHGKGIRRVGVFKSLENDTVADKKIYILIPHKSIEKYVQLSERLVKETGLQNAGKDYLNASYDKAPFARFETILLSAFDDMTYLEVPNHATPKTERVYELRSYEGPTERLYRNKVDMFNKGGEVKLFKRLGFNAVFYGGVIAGSRMPNLMYMTTFENMASRELHWKNFRNDPEWKELSAKPQYQKNVSKSDIILLRPADYSDI